MTSALATRNAHLGSEECWRSLVSGGFQGILVKMSSGTFGWNGDKHQGGKQTPLAGSGIKVALDIHPAIPCLSVQDYDEGCLIELFVRPIPVRVFTLLSTLRYRVSIPLVLLICKMSFSTITKKKGKKRCAKAVLIC